MSVMIRLATAKKSIVHWVQRQPFAAHQNPPEDWPGITVSEPHLFPGLAMANPCLPSPGPRKGVRINSGRRYASVLGVIGLVQQPR